MSKEDVRASVEQLHAAVEHFKATPEAPKDVGSYGEAHRQLLDALSTAVLAIGDEIVRVTI